MRYIVSIVMAFNSLLIVPALCMGGVITHACDCVGEPCCAAECNCNGQSGCGHEGGCFDDPCSIRVVRPDRQGDDTLAASRPALSTTIIDAAIAQQSVQTEFYDATHQWPAGKNLAFPSSDLPLLI